MVQTRSQQLTEPQRECLRLVLTHHSSKEIAELLGISPSAVDKRIERAIQMLGVTTRFQAARIIAAEEGGAAYERLPSEPIDVPTTPDPNPRTPLDEPWWLVRRLLGLTPEHGGAGVARNRLSRLRRLSVIVALVFLISMSLVALLNVGETLSDFVAGERDPPRR